MLDNQRQISLCTLLVYAGFVSSGTLLVLAEVVHYDSAGRWGIAVLCVTCTFSVHRALAAQDQRLRQAFDMGREYERESGLTSVR